MRAIRNAVYDIFSPVLSDRTISKYNKKGLLVEQLIRESQLQPNSVDLSLSTSWKKLKPNTQIKLKDAIGFRDAIDIRIPIEFEKGEFDSDGQYIVEPGEFVLMASNEILNIPNGIIGIACGRSSIARLAIQTEQAGFIDAGFRGTITLEVFNQSKLPIPLYAGMRVAQVYFLKAQIASVLYGKGKNSKYNDQIQATESRIHLDRELRHISNR